MYSINCVDYCSYNINYIDDSILMKILKKGNFLLRRTYFAEIDSDLVKIFSEKSFGRKGIVKEKIHQVLKIICARAKKKSILTENHKISFSFE